MELRRGAHRTVTRSAVGLPPALALELSNVTKYYGQTTALADASLAVRAGTIHAVLGENGAGKTTLMRVAYGMVHADTGEVRIHGQSVRLASPADAIAAGIGMVHQHFTLVPAMTVAENIALGGRGLLRTNQMAKRVEELSARTGFVLEAHARIGDLSVGAQQRVEIAKALARDAAVLILDEPTAVLAPAEADDLLRWLRVYADEGGSVILVTHKLKDALAIADDVTVLRNGRCVSTGSAAESSVPQLTAAMLGAAFTVSAPPQTDGGVASGAPVINAEAISVIDSIGRTRVRSATLAVRGGERVGIAAVEGAGQRELLRALAGRLPVSEGRVTLPPLVGFVPEDRHGDALLLDGSLVENVALRGAGQRHGIMPWAALRALTSRLIAHHDVRAQSSAQAARTLSGGNQQKLVLARELDATKEQSTPRAIVVENPTRGLDVYATAAVHARLIQASMDGAAVILYSSDLDEVLALATRVVVMFNGTLTELPPDRRLIGEAMLGLHLPPPVTTGHLS
jgi:ABC-type uncharacterized transport system ATPase subunit